MPSAPHPRLIRQTPALGVYRCFFNSVLLVLLGLVGPIPATRAFYVDGTVIRDAGGAEFVVRGTNVGGYNWHSTRDSGADAARIANVWRFNTVRIANYVGPNPWNNGSNIPAWRADRAYLHQIIAKFRAAGLVAIISTHDLLGRYTGPATVPSRTQIRDFWIETAQLYKNDPGVWFNLRNEPGDNSYNWGEVNPAWKSEVDDLLGAIRATGAHNIVMLDDASWGQAAGTWSDSRVSSWSSATLKWGQQIASTSYSGLSGNVVFSWHVYEQWNEAVTRLPNFIQDVRALGLCLVAGEYGSFNNDSTLPATRLLRDIAFPQRVGAIVWGWGDAGDYNDLTIYQTTPWDQSGGGWTLLFDAAGAPSNLTELGRIVWDYNRVQFSSQPDIAVTAIRAVPETFAPGANIRYAITVRNQSAVATGPFWLGVTVDVNGAYADWGGRNVNLAPGATTTITTHHGSIAPAGDFVVSAFADYPNFLAESDEDNNIQAVSLAGVVPAPDLVVDSLTMSPANAAPGTPVTYAVTVRNRGDLGTGSFWLGALVNVDGAYAAWGGFNANLAPGASVTITSSSALAPRLGAVAEAFADYPGFLTESNESNNRRSVTLR